MGSRAHPPPTPTGRPSPHPTTISSRASGEDSARLLYTSGRPRARQGAARRSGPPFGGGPNAGWFKICSLADLRVCWASAGSFSLPIANMLAHGCRVEKALNLLRHQQLRTADKEEARSCPAIPPRPRSLQQSSSLLLLEGAAFIVVRGGSFNPIMPEADCNDRAVGEPDAQVLPAKFRSVFEWALVATLSFKYL